MKTDRLWPLVYIWTDGSCKGNPGKGGWAAVLAAGNTIRVIGGYHPLTTNNRMELQAAYEAIKVLRVSSRVVLHTDSMYVVYGFEKVFRGALPTTHTDIWSAIRSLTMMHSIEINKVKGHDDDVYNNLADTIAGKCAYNQFTYDRRCSEPASVPTLFA